MRWFLMTAVIVAGLYFWARHVAVTGDEQTAFDAVERGDTGLLVRELDHGVDVNASRLLQGQTLLMAAASAGHADAVRVLLARGADPDRGNSIGFTPAMMAAGQGNTNVVKILVQAGATTRGTSPAGKSAVVIARECGHQEVVAVLSR
ncbi:MAG: ankyrin repeat domain-containing protein [Tepidisphaerales bacterium]